MRRIDPRRKKKPRQRFLNDSPEFGEWMSYEGPDEDDDEISVIMVGMDCEQT